MKILILGFSKIKYMPYLNFYLEHMDSSVHDIHLVYWNRDGQDEDLAALGALTTYEFKARQHDSMPRGRKLFNFIRYRKFVSSIIRKEAFDLVVILHSLPGILIHDLLKRKYRERYIFDYRDITYEHIPLYKRLIHGLVCRSWATFVSSDGFRAVLPESSKIYTSHNLSMDALSHREERKLHPVPSGKIRVCFWGFIRDGKANLQLIDRFSRDDRFELHYYGREQQTARKLKAYAKEIGARNVFFHGEYSPADKCEFAGSTDIIHNLFSSRKMLPAMSNKYYDGVVFQIPQIFMEGSFMAERAVERGVGIGCDPWDEHFTDVVYQYCATLDRQEFEQACRREVEETLREYKTGGSIIRRFTER